MTVPKNFLNKLIKKFLNCYKTVWIRFPGSVFQLLAEDAWQMFIFEFFQTPTNLKIIQRFKVLTFRLFDREKRNSISKKNRKPSSDLELENRR